MLEVLYKRKSGGRFQTLLYVIILIFAGLITRLAYLQIVEGDFYSKRAEGNRLRILPMTAARGAIFDRNGQVLATSRPAYAVIIMPTEKQVPDEEIVELSKIIGIPPEVIKKKIADHKDGYTPVRIATDVGMDVVTKIEERKQLFPGISIDVEPLRYYPHNEMMSQILGYVGEVTEEELKKAKENDEKNLSQGSIIGRTGLENIYDRYLRGSDGGLRVEVDAAGRAVMEMGRKKTIPGRDIHLTIDLKLQQAAEKAVRDQLAYLHAIKIPATGAAVVAMDPNTGAILAMVSYPEFNPNSFARGISTAEWNGLNNNPYHPFDNKVISGQYPPGSPFKIITGAAALETKKVTPDEKIYDSGKHWLIDKVNAEGEALGWIDFTEAMAKSDNVYFYEMGNRLGIDIIEKYAKIFGLGQKTGIKLYGEAVGNVASEKYKREVFDQDWYLGETFDAAIGQSYTLVTPIQMAVMMSEIANGGIRYEPYIVSRIDNLDGTPLEVFSPKKTGTLQVSKSIMDIIRNALHDVAQEGGTAGDLFKNFPIKVAGKTGTAEVAKGYDHGWFVAYAPYDKPRIVVVAIVEQGSFGAMSAAPIVKSILESYFNIPAIKPVEPAKKTADKKDNSVGPKIEN